MTETGAWKLARGDAIGDDHVWWFHRTFREASPGGHGRARIGGRRSRSREVKGVAAGQRNGKWLDDNPGYLLALCLLGLGEADTVGEAAFQAVMLREWSGVPPTRQAFNERTAGERSYHRRDAVEGEVRRLRDKLYAERGADEELFSRRIVWLRDTPGIHRELASYRAALIHRTDLPSRP